MKTHAEIDERSMALACAVAAKIDADPRRRGLEKARARAPTDAQFMAALERLGDM